ncbi:flavin reductase family protein [Enterovirga rhinocerotis]|uniref:Flavin reductase (DIM6/NTAB) family NADH-FMN oxidoreductase RutF n=1 Tax=Enterovirga rhinocerotis TaxID=1339210 RepID=A0A4R7BIV9_9HYPH|nr:flavin reductase family protein [Enterovirga rhinocerotis]TDR85270.1 flavin reductase (DIM6/NTAB) family NADH-FMN oxidoreductase RutF [Enterovirga rhinocerotis]
MTISSFHNRSPISLPERGVPRSTPDLFRQAMRQLAGGISVITVGEADDRTGLTATSVSSLSVDPPTLIVCVNLSSSSWPLIERYGRFGVNLLGEGHRAIADRFAGRGGETGARRYDGAFWETFVTGAPILKGALAALDCEVDEVIVRHSHAIVIGGVAAARIGEASAPLVYWQGRYVEFTHD